jgi:SRSO17 transposase
VQRQYTGTAGRIENAQVAVYLTYASAGGHALIDRELYLPRVWADDTDRREQAGVPAEVKFATKPALATEMITRALDAGVSARWVAGDEVYGADPKLRKTLEDRGVGYVLAVACSHQVRTGVGKSRADDLSVTGHGSGMQAVRGEPGGAEFHVFEVEVEVTDDRVVELLGSRVRADRGGGTVPGQVTPASWSPSGVRS